MKTEAEMTQELKAIEKQTGEMFHALHSSQIPLHDSYILILLSMFKDGLVDLDDPEAFISKMGKVKFIERSKLDVRLKLDAEQLKNKDLIYNKILEGFFFTFDKAELDLPDELVPKSSIQNSWSKIFHADITRRLHEDLFARLRQIDISRFRKVFPRVFESSLDMVSRIPPIGRAHDHHMLPNGLSKLMISLADLEPEADVFNPLARFAEFGTSLKKGQNYLAVDNDPYSRAIGLLRLLAHDQLKDATFLLEDPGRDWPHRDQKFDLIITSALFSAQAIRSLRDHSHENKRSIENFLFNEGILNLKENGKIITTIPSVFMWLEKFAKFRSELIDQDIIDTVISLPSRIFPHTSIPTSIIVLTKHKKQPGTVQFVNAERFTKGKLRSKPKLDIDRTLQVIQEAMPADSEYSIRVDQKEIEGCAFDLYPGRYLANEFSKLKAGKKLNAFLEPVKGAKPETKGTRAHLIRIQDLKDDPFQYQLDLNAARINSVSENSRKYQRIIDESVLLFALHWGSLKPTLFQYDGTPIAISPGIAAFRIKDEQDADPAFLINELHSEFVKSQLIRLQKPDLTRMHFLKKDDILELVVDLPSIEAQKGKVDGIKELTQKINRLREERNSLVHGEQLTARSEFASLKHTLGRPRQNILSWSNNLLHFFGEEIDNSSAQQLNKVFQGMYSMTLMDALGEIKTDVNFMTSVLEKGDRGFLLEDHKLRFMSLSAINKIIGRISDNGLSFQLHKSLLEEGNLKNRGISCNEHLLKTLVDNVLTNAHKHAFETTDPANKVVLELTDCGDQLQLTCKDNGKGFPKNFSREKFITKFSTSVSKGGTGIGGYDIDRIARQLGDPDWTLDLEADPLYRVVFTFEFPIKSMD